MRELLCGSSYFWCLLTVVLFLCFSSLQRRFGSALLNPILLSACAVALFLKLTGIPNSAYQGATKPIAFLLTPATICLALSFYEQVKNLKGHIPVIAAGVVLGSAASMGSIFLLCGLFGLDRTFLFSLLPKSVTTAIGVALCEEAGGLTAVTASAIIGTGVLGNIAGPALCRLFRIQSPVAQGVAFGTASHVIGTTRAQELSALSGAVSSLSLTLAGLLTAVAYSFLLGIL